MQYTELETIEKEQCTNFDRLSKRQERRKLTEYLISSLSRDLKKYMYIYIYIHTSFALKSSSVIRTVPVKHFTVHFKGMICDNFVFI